MDPSTDPYPEATSSVSLPMSGSETSAYDAFGAFVDACPTGAVVLSAAGEVARANDSLCRMLGVPSTDLAGQSISDIVCSRDATTARDAFAAMVSGGGASCTMRVCLRSGSGVLVPVILSISRYRAPGSPDCYCALVNADVAGGMRASNGSPECEERFYDILDHAPQPYQALDEHGCIMRVNQEWLDLFGHRRADVIEQPLDLFLVPEDVPRFRDVLGRVLASGQDNDGLWRMVRQDGGVVSVHVVSRAARRANGCLDGIHCLLTDVTELKRLAARQRLDEDRLETMFRMFSRAETQAVDLPTFAIEESERLTGSSAGLLAFVSEDESELTVYCRSPHCANQRVQSTEKRTVAVTDAGLWAEPLRQRRPVITNDYMASDPLIKGVPEGHVPLRRHMGVPVFDNGRVVAVAGFANKETDYDEGDVRQVSLLMHGLWVMTRHQSDVQALRESEERFARAFQTSPDALCIIRLSDGAYLYVNEAACTYTGYSEDEIIGSSWLEVPEWLDRSLQDTVYERLLAAGETRNLEFDFRCKDGGIITGQVSGKLVDFGGVPCVLCITRDVTDRKRNAEAVRFQTDVLRNVQECLVVIDRDGHVIFWNEGAEHAFGYTEKEMLGRTPRDLYSADVAGRLDEILSETSRARVTEREWLGVRKDESNVWMQTRTCPMTSVSGEVVGFLSSGRDITEHKHLEEQLLQAQKLESIGRLAGGIAHDFNNLLTAIIGCADMALDELPESDPVGLYVRQIGQAADRAAALTRQLLAFARKQHIEPKIVDPGELMSAMDGMLRRIIGEDIHMRTVCPDGIWPVKIDRSQIEQVLVNLVVNARDAMPDGGSLTIEASNVDLDSAYVRLHAEASPGPHVVLAVTDTGFGIAPADVPKLFEPFFTTKPVGRGTGLGLPMCYGAVKQAGGHITVYSEVGRGSTFRVYLPRCVDAIVAPSNVDQVVPGGRGDETVLLVEDEPLVLQTAVHALRGAGFRVLTAVTVEDALALVEAHGTTLGILVTDVVMPGATGGELANMVRERLPNLPVLFVSGYAESAITGQGVLGHNACFLSKPFTPDALTAKVRAVIDGATGETG